MVTTDFNARSSNNNYISCRTSSSGLPFPPLSNFTHLRITTLSLGLSVDSLVLNKKVIVLLNVSDFLSVIIIIK